MSAGGNQTLFRLGLKFFTVDGATPALHDLAPVFYQWIQKQAIPGHLLIDVHDYSHIHNGPGILLVAHEGNFSLDSGGGRFGLLYTRKTAFVGDLDSTLIAAACATLEACRLLEAEAGLRFRTDEALFVANDRLLAPNDASTSARLQPALQAAFRRLWTAGNIALEAAASGPKERFALRVRAPQGETIQNLLGRVSV